MLKDRILAEQVRYYEKRSKDLRTSYPGEHLLIEAIGWKDLGGLYSLNISARYDYPEN